MTDSVLVGSRTRFVRSPQVRAFGTALARARAPVCVCTPAVIVRVRERASSSRVSRGPRCARRRRLRRQGSRAPPPCGTSTAPWRPDKDGTKQVIHRRRRRSPRVGRAGCYNSSSVRGRVYRAAAKSIGMVPGRQARMREARCVRAGQASASLGVRQHARLYLALGSQRRIS